MLDTTLRLMQVIAQVILFPSSAIANRCVCYFCLSSSILILLALQVAHINIFHEAIQRDADFMHCVLRCLILSIQ